MANVYGTDSSETINLFDGVTNGADTIYGFGGNDTIYGLGGNDQIKGGGGADTINGGSGTDTASYSDSWEGVTVTLIAAAGYGGTAEGDTLNSIENVTGSSHDDFLIGDDGNNVLTGLEDNDVLKGGGGADTLYGDSGSDTLKGGGGADTLNGGSGIDTADYFDSSAGVFISLYNDVAAYGDAEGDELNSIENVKGSAHDDDLWGNDGVNVLTGRDGDDTLKGFGGADTLYGGADNDTLYGMDAADSLYGEAGSDELIGGAGNDTMNGGTGNDTMNGGTENDTYYVDSASDSVIEAAGQGSDTIYSSTTYALAAGAEIEFVFTTNDAGTTAIDFAGNGFNQSIKGNQGVNVLNGGGGTDQLDGRGGNDWMSGGAGVDTLTGGSGADTFFFAAGEAHGDTVVDFVGNGAAVGDVLILSGYGPGATFTQVDGSHWQVNYNGGASHDVITFLNDGANAIHSSDFAFI